MSQRGKQSLFSQSGRASGLNSPPAVILHPTVTVGPSELTTSLAAVQDDGDRAMTPGLLHHSVTEQAKAPGELPPWQETEHGSPGTLLCTGWWKPQVRASDTLQAVDLDAFASFYAPQVRPYGAVGASHRAIAERDADISRSWDGGAGGALGGAVMAEVQVGDSERNLFTLRLLASGLVQAHERGLLQAPPSPPYNRALQRSANRLTVDLLRLGMEPPGDLAALLQLCHTPLRQWSISFPDGAQYGQLLVGGVPSDVCYQWVVASPNQEWELVAQLLPKVMDECRIRGRPDWYASVRMALIQHPILDRATELRWHRDETMNALQEAWLEAYEPVPSQCTVNGEIWCCGYCGWTLEPDAHGSLRCGDDVCSLLVSNQKHKAVPRPKVEITRRLRAPVRRFVLLPGLPELALGRWLERQGLAVAYWPEYDRCDLRASFSDGAVWEVDVKDWAVPFLLAAVIREQPSRRSTDCERFLYVVPDHREKLFPGYERAVRNSLPAGNHEVCRMSRFKRIVKRRLEGVGRDA